MKDSTNNPPNDFDEYLRQSEPHQRERAESWKTAIGLQAVDGLKPSEYLVETAKRHIEGDISMEEVRHLIDSYYQGKTDRTPEESETEEADKVSASISRLLNEKTFTFSPAGYISIHRRIFAGVFSFAGQIRDYNITKKEWVLRGDTVLYASAEELRSTMEYDFEQESLFDYKGISPDTLVAHFTKFISGLWQIHPFAEGNTRTTAVFAIKYLRFMGFNVNNDMFADKAWYFRNALVRANYRNYQQGIESDTEHLQRFFRNVLLGETHELKTRYLRVNSLEERQKKHTSTVQVAHKNSTSSMQATDKFAINNPNLLLLIQTVGEASLSVTEMLAALHLQHRGNFLKTWLTPAIQSGILRPLYPDTPRHPRQKYLLSPRGREMYQQIKTSKRT
ncbi:MAG: Fic family protein [Akkermansia sp.]